jgi:L-2-hydroxyglutarate oxidase
VAVVGAGIVGLATAHALRLGCRERLIVLEAEDAVASHQTGHNSGVIHSGLYYRPGSLKARNCVIGREAMYRFCGERGIAHERCGKIVVAIVPSDLARLEELVRRGEANGLQGLTRLDRSGVRDHEPHATGLAGLYVPETGIVHYPDVARTLVRDVTDAGAAVITGARVLHVRHDGGELVLETPRGEWRSRALINCAGLQADRVARACGVEPDLHIVPFRGDYFELRPERRHLVRHLIYPTPDPRFPFLGVHFTRRIHGGIEAGPNAVLALRREGYGRFDVSARDIWDMAKFLGTWRMAATNWRSGAAEYRRAFSASAFVHALQRLVPDVNRADVQRAGSGVRAQAVDRAGRLLDDFHFLEADRMIHVLNTPSPAATACLSIGAAIAERARDRFALAAPRN